MTNNVDIGPKKTMFVLVIVIGCFSVLWPKVFYPMLVGNADQHMKPSAIDKTSGCCDVISEIDINTIKIMTELCNSIVNNENISEKITSTKLFLNACRKQILDTCGIDISVFLQEQVRLGHSTKRILDEVRSLNGSLCLKDNFGIAPWRLGVPHRITINLASTQSIRQERPAHLRPEMLHPALRERGRAIPVSSTSPPPRVVQGRPGPIPGMRPPMGGPGHVVPPPQKGTSTMSVVMPIYTVGIVIFFTYTLMKLMFKKPVDASGSVIYPTIQPDPNFRQHVFEAEPCNYISRHTKDETATKLGQKERETIVNAMSALLAEVDQDIEQDRLKAKLNQQVEAPNTENISNGNIANGNVSNGNAIQLQEQDDSAKVKILGMETTASCEGGQKWSRPNTPVIPASPIPSVELLEPAQSIYLEGSLPAQSQLLVSESATETETDSQDSAVVLSGKMTLSVISLDSLTDQQIENIHAAKEMEDDEEDLDEDEDEEDEAIADDDDKIEESKYTTASNATQAENDVSEDEENTDEEDENEMERD